MINYYKKITADILDIIHKQEVQQFSETEKIFQTKYADFLERHGIHYVIYVTRWIDDYCRCCNKQYDGYTAMLQIDLLDCNNSVIEVDENVCNFFEEITVIRYFPLRRKYRIYQATQLYELWGDIEKVVKILNGII